jgi:hypothetical protein
MIPITPQIIGPGIDEEYADAMERIERLEVLLRAFPPSNDTREGRMVYQLKWLRQEIEARRLPIPLDRKYWSTLAYLVGEGSIDYLGGATPMGELDNILDGVGLLKKRHYPVIGAMLDDFLDLVRQAPSLNPIEQKLVDEARLIRLQLAAGALQLPLDESQYPGWKSIYLDTPNLERLPDFGNRKAAVEFPLFEGWRPKPCRKGPLAAPNPGMVWGGP